MSWSPEKVAAFDRLKAANAAAARGETVSFSRDDLALFTEAELVVNGLMDESDAEGRVVSKREVPSA